MLIGDILHSCANDRVAEAAVTSIGGDFAERVGELARRCDLPVGILVGKLVRQFSAHASERDWRFVLTAMDGEDLPVLCGLRAVVDAAIRRPSVSLQLSTLASEASETGPVWIVGPDMRVGGIGVA